MWHRTCNHCGRAHLFGMGRVTGAHNLDRGVILLAWSCPTCGADNELLTGDAVGTHAPDTPTTPPVPA